MNDQHADLMSKTVVFSVAQNESICDEFECQWSPDLPSDFDHYFNQVSEAASPTLLRNLLQIELRRRKQAGQDVGKQQYLSQFPEHTDLIDDVHSVLPPGYRFKPNSPSDGLGTANVSLLPYLEQASLQNLIDPNIPWYLLPPTIATQQIPVFVCPSDVAPSPATYPFIAGLGLPAGGEFANSSYAYSMGWHDALAFSPWFGAPPVTLKSGIFAFHSRTKFRDVTDGTSNIFAIGEAASGFEMCSGIGCTTPLPTGETSAHGWLVGGSALEPFYAGGFRYAGNWGSTVEPINKTPVTDSFYKLSGGAFFDSRASTDGGPHRAPNFRSYHTGGASFLFLDGAVGFLSESIDMGVYRAVSSILRRRSC